MVGPRGTRNIMRHRRDLIRAVTRSLHREIFMTKLIALSIGIALLSAAAIAPASAKPAKAHHHVHHHTHHHAAKSAK